MDFSHFADVPVIDGHIHCKHPERMDGILAVMEGVPYTRINLLSMPDQEQINHNPAVIRFKSCYPDRAYISGGLDYVQAFADQERAAQNLVSQVETLKVIGFDGLKMYASSPRSRKWLKLPVDAPEYEGFWAKLEELDMPILSHVAGPEEFWDEKRIPDWARSRLKGGFYDDTFPFKEELYAEMDRVLERHPGLKLILAHFYFLSADLERAGDFLDVHSNVCFDLTPGLEMCNNFSRDREAARAFLIQYQDRMIYGTDITSMNLEKGDRFGLAKSLGKAWVVRSLLERDDLFTPPEELDYWLYPDLDGFRGLALPREALEKIYRTNFERLYGPSPVPLNRSKAIAELKRMAVELDEQADGEAIENPARQVAVALQG
jgi:predicted TIM-barrel fold metal-dependent hydrolase